jgi:hypothetical protein
VSGRALHDSVGDSYFCAHPYISNAGCTWGCDKVSGGAQPHGRGASAAPTKALLIFVDWLVVWGDFRE